MIVFDLCCREGHGYEGWFASSDDYASQKERGLVTCPLCGSADVDKAPMAPAVPRKGNRQPAAKPVAGGKIPPEAAALMQKIAKLQAEALKSSTWVGPNFAEQSRAMHYGERDPAPIHGQATPDEALGLVEEGIPVAPLLVPVVPPDEVN